MTSFRFSGVAVAAVTPFTQQGHLDRSLFNDLIEWWIGQGIQGLVLCGSTGEAAYLQPDERLGVFEAGVKAVAGRVPVWAGTGFADTPTTVSVTQAAVELGVDAALVVTPFYYPISDEAMFEHYLHIAESVNLPIFLYNMPPLTHVQLSVETIAALSKLDGIVGIKDSAGDMAQLKAIVDQTDKEFCVLTGSFPKMAEAIKLGANGAILAMANLIPDGCVRIGQLASEQKFNDAQALTEEFEYLQEWVKQHGISGIKHKLNEWHHPAGHPRRPFLPVTV